MPAPHSAIATSACLRAALKRGLAREALRHAGLAEADMRAIFEVARQVRPNAKSVERVAGRLGGLSGMVRVARRTDGGGLTLVLRNLRHLVNRAGAQKLFGETALVYTRVQVVQTRYGLGFDLLRASFCRHALERLVERSDVALNRPLLATVDAEAGALLRQFSRGRLIEDAGNRLIAGVAKGVWAGGVDDTGLEEDWGLAFSDPASRIAVFFARTFLSPEEMRPTLWAKWQDDPAIRVAA